MKPKDNKSALNASVRMDEIAPESKEVSDLHSEMLLVLPPKTIMALMHEAASLQDMPLLNMLADAGYYDITPSAQVFKVSDAHKYATNLIIEGADPRIASLAEVMWRTTKKEQSFDVYSGAPISHGPWINDKSFELLSANVSSEYFAFFQARVQAFTEQFKFIKKSSPDLFDGDNPSRIASEFELMSLTTGALLMGLAAAMNDAASIRGLAEISPESQKLLLDATKMGQRKTHDQPHTDSITPVAVAILYGGRDALEAFIDLGWLSQDAVCMRCFDAKKSVPASSTPLMPSSQCFNAVQWIKINLDQHGLFTFPSVAELIIEKSMPEQKSFVKDLTFSAMKGEKSKALLQELDRAGALKIDPNAFILTAIDHENWDAVKAVFSCLEWQKLTDQVKQCDLAADNSVTLAGFLSCFPPVALANKLNLGNADPSFADVQVAKFLQACINAGSGSLLALSGTANSPLRTMAWQNLPKSMLLCLEQGADYKAGLTEQFPHREGVTAEMLACENEATAKVMRSFIALKEANQAVREIRLSIV